jgi:hypothetical protein
MPQQAKVIVLDFGVFMHRAIFSTVNNPGIPATYTCLSMILGCLSRIGIDPDDTIIVAMDFLRSWRRELEDSYKADRAKKREDSSIDFKEQYRLFDDLVRQLDEATSWHFIRGEHLEADDIMAAASRYFSAHEVVLVTYDSDLEQCWYYPNVKIFSPISKAYKLKPKNFNAYQLISKKIEKEATDNLTAPVLNQQDYEKRLRCINLIELPDWVENFLIDVFKNLPEKPECLEKIPFKSIRNRFGSLYSGKSRMITYEDCMRKEERKAKRKFKAKEKTEQCATTETEEQGSSGC